MSDELTAADYVYLDRMETLYMGTKEFIASHRNPNLVELRRPGIPGTLGALQDRVTTLVSLGQFDIAARLIEKKVRKAYKQENTP